MEVHFLNVNFKGARGFSCLVKVIAKQTLMKKILTLWYYLFIRLNSRNGLRVIRDFINVSFVWVIDKVNDFYNSPEVVELFCLKLL